jgi:hypothetical protein
VEGVGAAPQCPIHCAREHEAAPQQGAIHCAPTPISPLGKAPPFPEEDLEQRKKDFLTFLLGSAHPPLSS